MPRQEALEGLFPAGRPASDEQLGLLTVGHGAAGQDEFAGLLRDAEVTELVDVRRYPGSRAHPHFGRDPLSRWLPAVGVAYRWEPRLGGRRSLPGNSPDSWWQVAAFRAYAHHMRSREFQDAIGDLLSSAHGTGTVIMCSESLWWRCHRRMVADFVVLTRELPVRHLDHRGRLTPHPIADGARLTSDGLLVYDQVASP